MGSTAQDHSSSQAMSAPVISPPCRSYYELVLATRGSSLARVVEVVGEVDLFTAAALADCLAACLADGTPVIVVVDLRQVDFLAGLSVLVAANHQARAQRTSLRLVVTTRPVRRVLSVTGLDRSLVIYPALVPALAC